MRKLKKYILTLIFIAAALFYVAAFCQESNITVSSPEEASPTVKSNQTEIVHIAVELIKSDAVPFFPPKS